MRFKVRGSVMPKRHTVTFIIFAIYTSSGCDGTSPFVPPPLVLHAHVAGQVRNDAGQIVSGVDVTIACPLMDSLPVYPSSARLAQSKASDNTGRYDSWIGIDEAALRQSGRPTADLKMTCTVRALRNSQLRTVSPTTTAVPFVPVPRAPPITTLDLQLTD
jgi:hypothetical protein